MVPIDWRPTAAEFAATIATYQQACGTGFDLGPAAEAVHDLSAALDDFHAALATGNVEPKTANTALRALARILVPINYTRGSRFTHDPALNVPALPTIAEAVELAAMPADLTGFALTQLLRGRNRLVAALREATAIVKAAT